jgi:hypothetical protein
MFERRKRGKPCVVTVAVHNREVMAGGTGGDDAVDAGADGHTTSTRATVQIYSRVDNGRS